MKIYFAASIRGGRQDAETYAKLIEHLKNYGEVLTEHVGDNTLTNLGQDAPAEVIFQRDYKWVKEADAIVAEVSTPSLGVGYELGKTEEWKKANLCLYNGEIRRLSPMISGNKFFKTKRYASLEEANILIDEFFTELNTK